MAEIANIATATARRMWLHNHIRKPTIHLNHHIARQTLRSVEQCYEGRPEEKLIKQTANQIIARFNKNQTDRI